ncbi:MAG: HAD-IA family hydrolase [Opitutus sp.]|jgi:putative hydrolase of the HAD superfamily|nr:HAD-IA family hydrolase [Opitutus sp.]MCS6245973.1 HAD-IA family hydrolase [Opitutus sp.]MCS6275338.1 HAD-IA family hydrolase [Opitutus sp.]MCS6275946.1 HAD-IA family hydrolase [Opitutus sp.]MCS6301041.1 HAD-IA family hydrolase [Opitutus sp.]
MLRALIFDFDGLLVDTETVLIDAWEQMHAVDGLPCDRAVLHHIVGHTDVIYDYWSAYGPEISRATLETRYRETARELTLAAPPLPGTIDLLNAARAAGLRIGLASNSTHAHVEGHLEHRGMRGYFDFIACRDDVTIGKPEPDVYLHALQGLSVEPSAALAFEDSVPGHVAAHRAGLRVVVVPNPSTGHCEFTHAWLQLTSMADTSLAALTRQFST